MAPSRAIRNQGPDVVTAMRINIPDITSKFCVGEGKGNDKCVDRERNVDGLRVVSLARCRVGYFCIGLVFLIPKKANKHLHQGVQSVKEVATTQFKVETISNYFESNPKFCLFRAPSGGNAEKVTTLANKAE